MSIPLKVTPHPRLSASLASQYGHSTKRALQKSLTKVQTRYKRGSLLQITAKHPLASWIKKREPSSHPLRLRKVSLSILLQTTPFVVPRSKHIPGRQVFTSLMCFLVLLISTFISNPKGGDSFLADERTENPPRLKRCAFEPHKEKKKKRGLSSPFAFFNTVATRLHPCAPRC